jgi:exodeoxyribonuclease-3
VRIATWNINGLRARLEFLCIWLQERTPDLIALQELKLPDDQFPHAALEALGYLAYTHGQPGWNGVAVLSRQPARVVERGLPGAEELGARLIAVEVGGLTFLSIYCPNGKETTHVDFPRKIAWLDALADYLGTLGSESAEVVVGGDFNVCPAPIDSWNEAALTGHIFHTEVERARVRRLEEMGFVDWFRRANPELQAFTWWDYRAGAFHRGQGLRIDLLLGRGSICRSVRSVTIDREYRKKKEGHIASDHAPLFADVD